MTIRFSDRVCLVHRRFQQHCSYITACQLRTWTFSTVVNETTKAMVLNLARIIVGANFGFEAIISGS